MSVCASYLDCCDPPRKREVACRIGSHANEVLQAFGRLHDPTPATIKRVRNSVYESVYRYLYARKWREGETSAVFAIDFVQAWQKSSSFGLLIAV